MVDTDRTASQILSIMNRNKMRGEVTFLPLNKLQPPNPHYPNNRVTIRRVPSSCGVILRGSVAWGLFGVVDEVGMISVV